MNNLKKVGITGASGFIGSFNTKKFLAEGYAVKASVTDISRKDKYQHLLKLPNAQNLEIVELDVQNGTQLENFLKDCSIVVHGGTPFQLEVQDPKAELFDPTIKGTENFLELVKDTPGVEKVVFIASVAAFNTNFPMLPEGKTENDQVTEQDPPYMNKENHPYAQAKFMAHQTVEKFIAGHSSTDLEIVTVSPVMVTGRAMSAREDCTSMGLQHLIQNKIAPNDFLKTLYDLDVYWALVGVEDVAEGVYKAAVIKGVHGRNYLLSSESYRISDISQMLNQKPPMGEAKIVYNSALAQKELEMQFKPARQVLHGFTASTVGA